MGLEREKTVMRLLLAVMLLASASASAEFFTGNDLHDACAKDDHHSRGFCLGFIAGVYDTAVSINFCHQGSSAKVTAAQVRDIVKKHLSDNPAQRHRTAYALAIESLKTAFGACKL